MTTHSVIAGIAAWIATFMKGTEQLATSVAAAVLIIIMTATKGAFCKMATEDAKGTIAARAK